ncbi:MAG: hypothetical protein K5989_03620 [Lachnospiraceae bacterium]|nr:hypothetical protein [Lachnospiraceae bacterium]
MIRFSNFNYGNLFGYGSGNSLFNNLSQFSGIRSGSFSKALKSYYGRNKNAGVSQKNNAWNKYGMGSNLTRNALSDVSGKSSDLSESAKKLTDSSKKGLFASEEAYDSDAAYKALSDFVKDYNDTMDSVKDTTNITVTSLAGSMKRMTGIMSRSLNSIGLRVEKDGKMTLDEEEFKDASFDSVKSMLGANSSFARVIGSSAQRLASAAEQQNRQTIGNSGIYGRYGSYLGNYGFPGTGFDSWF